MSLAQTWTSSPTHLVLIVFSHLGIGRNYRNYKVVGLPHRWNVLLLFCLVILDLLVWAVVGLGLYVVGLGLFVVTCDISMKRWSQLIDVIGKLSPVLIHLIDIFLRQDFYEYGMKATPCWSGCIEILLVANHHSVVDLEGALWPLINLISRESFSYQRTLLFVEKNVACPSCFSEIGSGDL